ncbi:cinnamyl-alcohol dehydrogenase [Scheffersomyces xylosifermentans]|uniref:cinnamyl-alcohol dehydrogenase n=1 Tax=Scheffersomyces xylosifermentans TaxID=1304137 RepID=UPI00315DFAEF
MSQNLVLVTGGTGYIASFTILQLLQQGYNVRTSIRSLAKEEKLRSSFEGLVGKEVVEKNLDVFAADLSSDANWEQNFKGVDYVLHLASPFPLAEPENPDDLIIPAREGTLRILKASAKEPSVKQVVITSSFGSIGYGHGNSRTEPFTEKDWTQVDGEGVSTYIKSKTLAEKAAWDFVNENKPHFHLTVIAPAGIFGPVLPNSTANSSSIDIIKAILFGAFKDGVPIYAFPIVDVRDVAKIHIASIENPKAYNERFLLCGTKVYNLLDVAASLKKSVPESFHENFPTKELDGSKAPVKKVDTKKVIEAFDWTPVATEDESLAASAKSVLEASS